MPTEETTNSPAGLSDLVKAQNIQQLLQPLPSYDGTSLDACRQWIEYLDFVYGFIQGSTSEKLHQIKRACLSRASGDVLQYLYKFLKDETPESPISWEKLKESLQQRFGDPSIKIAAQAELNRPRQQPFETPQSFVDRVRNLAKIAYDSDDYENASIQANLSKLIIGGLNDTYLARRIHKKNKNTLQEVFDEMVLYLGEQRVFNLIRDPVLLPYGQDTTVSATNPFLSNVTAQNHNTWPISNQQNSFNIMNHNEPMEVSAFNKMDTSRQLLTPKLAKIMDKNEKETNAKLLQKNEEIEMPFKNEKFDEIKKDLNKIQQNIQDDNWHELKNAISEIEATLKYNKNKNGNKKYTNKNYYQNNQNMRTNEPKRHFSYSKPRNRGGRTSRPIKRNDSFNNNIRQNFQRRGNSNNRYQQRNNSERNRAKKINCYSCNEPNHLSTNCEPGLTCFKCKCLNHRAINCQHNLN